MSGKVASIKIHDIEVLEDRKEDDVGLLPQATAMSQTFWNSPALEELAYSQNVRPVSDVQALFGTWLGEIDDGFETAIYELRHPRAEHGIWS